MKQSRFPMDFINTLRVFDSHASQPESRDSPEIHDSRSNSMSLIAKSRFRVPHRHEYHKNCIDQWLLEQRTCPICKLDILQAYGLQVTCGPGGGGSGPTSSPSAPAQHGGAASAAPVPRDVRLHFHCACSLT